jgi:hypothetical protein
MTGVIPLSPESRQFRATKIFSVMNIAFFSTASNVRYLSVHPVKCRHDLAASRRQPQSPV